MRNKLTKYQIDIKNKILKYRNKIKEYQIKLLKETKHDCFILKKEPNNIFNYGSYIDYGGAYCEICRDYKGWYCPDSPDLICDYEIGEYDHCIHCGYPDERK